MSGDKCRFNWSLSCDKCHRVQVIRSYCVPRITCSERAQRLKLVSLLPVVQHLSLRPISCCDCCSWSRFLPCSCCVVHSRQWGLRLCGSQALSLLVLGVVPQGVSGVGEEKVCSFCRGAESLLLNSCVRLALQRTGFRTALRVGPPGSR